VILAEFEQYMPDLFTTIQLLKEYLGADHSSRFFADRWAAIKPETIDYGIMENHRRPWYCPLQTWAGMMLAAGTHFLMSCLATRMGIFS